MSASDNKVEIIDLTISSPPSADPEEILANTTVKLDIQHLPCPPSKKGRNRVTQEKAAEPSKSDAPEPQDADANSSSHPRRSRKRKDLDTLGDSQANGRRRKSYDNDNFKQPPTPKLARSGSRSPLDDDLFFVDVEPVTIPAALPQTDAQALKEERPTLLLPAHVAVFGSTPVEILPPTTSLEDDSIEFLDYDDTKQFPRYWDNPETKLHNRILCKNCGAEGDHKTSACPVIICWTCGARDEHLMRSCPISKTCFTCGMKGHINATCPNRRGNRISSSRFVDCERCSSVMHKTNECPTWWRMYLYLSDESQERALSFREERREHKLGEGGEGYVAREAWCYNCGQCGHWGDDCSEATRPDRPSEPSAFSFHNISSGPFYDPEKDLPSSSSTGKKGSRHIESFMELERVPDDVGRRGKERAKSRLGKMMQERAVDDDQDDWFSKARTSGDKRKPSNNSKTITFSTSLQNKRDFSAESRPPSLLSRLGDRYGKKTSYGDGSDSKGLLSRFDDPPTTSYSNSRRKRDRQSRQDNRRSPDFNVPKGKDGKRYDYNDYGREHHPSNNNRRDRSRPRQENDSHRPRYRGGYSR